MEPMHRRHGIGPSVGLKVVEQSSFEGGRKNSAALEPGFEGRYKAVKLQSHCVCEKIYVLIIRNPRHGICVDRGNDGLPLFLE